MFTNKTNAVYHYGNKNPDVYPLQLDQNFNRNAHDIHRGEP